MPLILDLIQGEKVFIVDEMERSLHPSLIKQIILLFYKYSKDVSSQLIFTTHESSLMDQKIFRRDEIWLMKKDNNGISSFGRMDNLYNVRFDKMLQNSYLNGEYGATPIFETEEEINKLFSSLK
ncbi:ATP-binding protein [Bacteroides fragilis]|nr:ATP-binding protein [Bacteroides fragilis]